MKYIIIYNIKYNMHKKYIDKKCIDTTIILIRYEWWMSWWLPRQYVDNNFVSGDFFYFPPILLLIGSRVLGNWSELPGYFALIMLNEWKVYLSLWSANEMYGKSGRSFMYIACAVRYLPDPSTAGRIAILKIGHLNVVQWRTPPSHCWSATLISPAHYLGIRQL